ncbi:MAG: Rad52/Rad22 family DNA repair protein [Caldilineaceae bacterium]
MNQILDELSKPFHPSRITWRPGALTGKKDKALALAYADLRAYQNRLDEICGMEWSVSYTPWGDRIICHLTINGITRSSTGEPDSDSERSEIAGTTAEAQAFKRACAMFGLGRYLYNLPALWVEYDAPNQRFTEKTKARLQGLIAQHYQRFLDGQTDNPLESNGEETPEEVQVSEATSSATAPSSATPEAAPTEPATPVAAVAPKKQATKKQVTIIAERPAKTNGEGNGEVHGEGTEDTLLPLRKKLDELGKELYGEQWAHVRAHNIKRLVGEQGDGNGSLSQEQIQTLINGLKKLKQQRQAA